MEIRLSKVEEKIGSIYAFVKRIADALDPPAVPGGPIKSYEELQSKTIFDFQQMVSRVSHGKHIDSPFCIKQKIN